MARRRNPALFGLTPVKVVPVHSRAFLWPAVLVHAEQSWPACPLPKIQCLVGTNCSVLNPIIMGELWAAWSDSCYEFFYFRHAASCCEPANDRNLTYSKTWLRQVGLRPAA